MPSPRFRHGFRHDVFISYTHADNRADGTGREWVNRFEADLKARLEAVSGASIDIYKDTKLDVGNPFDDVIRSEIRDTAVLLVVLSPSYFRSDYCKQERSSFLEASEGDQDRMKSGKGRIVKVAKFFVPREMYPDDLARLLELKFYCDIPGTNKYRELHLHEDPDVRSLYHTRVDDVAQEITTILQGLESETAPAKGKVYLAETTSDLQVSRDDLRRCLTQLGYEVLPHMELRLAEAAALGGLIRESIRSSLLAIHPVGGFYGIVPEGADGKSLIELQIEVAGKDDRNGDLKRIIWIPEGLQPREEAQRQFLKRIRDDKPGAGFEVVEAPLAGLTTHVRDRLEPPATVTSANRSSQGVYLICDNADRAIAKNLRLYLFKQEVDVEWTPLSIAGAALSESPEHKKLLQRNHAHLLVHGETNDAWLQDRIQELCGIGAIYLADPARPDKEDVLVRNLDLIPAYSPTPVSEALGPFIRRLRDAGFHVAGEQSQAQRGGAM